MKKSWDWFFVRGGSEGMRFATFSFTHFVYIVIGVAVIACLVWSVRRHGKYHAGTIIKGTSILLLAFYFLRAYMFYRYFDHFKLLDIVPLHLCIISGFILPVAAFAKNELLWNISYGVLMPGALIAIITPEVTLTGYHAFSWMPMIFFIWHFLVVLIPVLQIASGRLIPDIRLYPRVIMTLGIYALFIFALNKWLGTNYLYLNGAAEGTVLALFQRWLGNPGYIIPMALMVLVVSFLMFVPWARKRTQENEFDRL